MITEDKTVRVIKPKRFAIIEAMRCYGKWKKIAMWGRICFVIDLIDHLINGFVAVRPDLFWMMKIINVSKTDKPEFAWFVRMCHGDLNELLATMPVILPKIVFCRRGDKRVRVYSTVNLIKKARGMV